MCTPETKQEILFLFALSQADVGLTSTGIVHAMTNAAKRLGWPDFLVRTPTNVDRLLSQAAYYKHVCKVTPFHWAIGREGEKRYEYIVGRYASSQDRSALQSANEVAA